MRALITGTSMVDFDWYLVLEVALGVALGIIAGAVVAVGLVRSLAYELLSHPSVRKIASAADKLGGKGGGMLEQIAKSLLGGGGPA